MFWQGKISGLYMQIHTKYLKEKQYYKLDCGCRREYESIQVETKPVGNTFKIKTTLYRDIGDSMLQAFQPIWDDKKLQARLKKESEDEKKGIEKKEKKYKPTKYRKLTQKDYRDILLSYTIFYKWAKENLKEDWYLFDRIKGVINTLNFAYKGVADITNSLYDNDINTIDLIDLNIARLTLTRKQCSKFYDKWLSTKHEEREVEEKSVLKGLICHKCEVPMKEVEYKHRFVGKGHSCPAWLRGRKCPKCGFEIFLPKDIENYMEQNRSHYLIFSSSDGWLKKNKNNLPKEVEEIIEKNKKSSKKFDDLWKLKHKRDEKVLEDIRKKRDKSKYFGSMKNESL